MTLIQTAMLTLFGCSFSFTMVCLGRNAALSQYTIALTMFGINNVLLYEPSVSALVSLPSPPFSQKV
jgi:hypothetical protein